MAVLWPIEPSIVLAHGDVELRLTKPADARELFEALDHDECWTHVRGRPEEEDDVVQTIIDATRRGRWMWTVRQREVIVGTTSFLDVVSSDERIEIGWTAYTPSAWASKVNPTAKFLLMQCAFDRGFGRVQLKTDVRNLRSQAAIARLGATNEGVLRRYQRRADDSMRDTVMFSVLADEWPQVRAGLLARIDS